jgi:hypothetical protein
MSEQPIQDINGIRWALIGIGATLTKMSTK